MRTILETDFASVEFFEEDFLVQIIWKKVKALPIEEYQKAFNSALNFQAENKEKVKYFLSDIRSQGVLAPDYRKWFQDVAMPQAVSNNLKCGAVLFEGNVFQKYYLNNILNSIKKFGMPMKFFSKREDALEWFKTM